METYLTRIIDYLINVLHSTFNQLFISFGPLLVLFILLNFSATLSARLSVRFLGRNLFLYGFGWLGCTVHELSHAFFAVIFGHKITEIELFKPNNNGESLGHVTHSFNKKSIYQKIGNFFIGISPLIAGGIVLFLGTLFIYGFNVTERSSFRISTDVFTDLSVVKQIGINVWSSLISYASLVFFGSLAVWWKTTLLIYILYSTGSSMTLSKSDLAGALYGFLWLVVFLLIFNLITLWIGDFATSFLRRNIQYISGFYFLLMLFLAANILIVTLLFVLNVMKNLFIQK